jgi:hypothetical protein
VEVRDQEVELVVEYQDNRLMLLDESVPICKMLIRGETNYDIIWPKLRLKRGTNEDVCVYNSDIVLTLEKGILLSRQYGSICNLGNEKYKATTA